jgi:hypothetical protein
MGFGITMKELSMTETTQMQAFSEDDFAVERDVISRQNAPVPTTELRGKGLYDHSNSENMNNQNN